MTDHLPECLMLDERYPKHPLENCDYCNMLRSCEQRVTENLPAVFLGHGDEKTVLQIRDMGYAAGVAAARDAVAALPPITLNSLRRDGSTPAYDVVIRDAALAAIDALRGKS